MDLTTLGELQLDALREVANIGAGHAATALSQLTHRVVMVQVPKVSIVPLERVGGMLGDPGEAVSAVIVKLEGEVTGRTLQVFPGPTASRLTGIVLRLPEPAFPDGFGLLERSALKEIGNIMVGAYLRALTDFIHVRFDMSVPGFAIDMAAAILTTSYINFGSEEDHVFCITTQLRMGEGEDMPAHFLLIPEADSLLVMLRALRVI
jgi:chemotaxis protein CheC